MVKQTDKSELFVAGVEGPYKRSGRSRVFNTQICFLPYSRDSFPYFSRLVELPKIYKSSTLYFSQFEIFYVSTHFVNLHFLIFMEKVMPFIL